MVRQGLFCFPIKSETKAICMRQIPFGQGDIKVIWSHFWRGGEALCFHLVYETEAIRSDRIFGTKVVYSHQ